jgi:hypothetical protein
MQLTDGDGADALFAAPTGIASDASGKLFVADYYNNSIRKGIVGSLQTITFPRYRPRPSEVPPLLLEPRPRASSQLRCSSSASNIAGISSNMVKILGAGRSPSRPASGRKQ